MSYLKRPDKRTSRESHIVFKPLVEIEPNVTKGFSKNRQYSKE